MKYLLLFIILLSFSAASCGDNQIDINSADINELDEIVWIGESTAQKIISERPFEKLEDLRKIYGIGEKKLKDIIDEGLACVDSEEKIIEKKEVINENYINKKTPQNIETDMIFLGEEDESQDKLIYESKNSIVARYLPYLFLVFLIIIIAILLLQKI